MITAISTRFYLCKLGSGPRQPGIHFTASTSGTSLAASIAEQDENQSEDAEDEGNGRGRGGGGGGESAAADGEEDDGTDFLNLMVPVGEVPLQAMDSPSPTSSGWGSPERSEEVDQEKEMFETANSMMLRGEGRKLQRRGSESMKDDRTIHKYDPSSIMLATALLFLYFRCSIASPLTSPLKYGTLRILRTTNMANFYYKRSQSNDQIADLVKKG